MAKFNQPKSGTTYRKMSEVFQVFGNYKAKTGILQINETGNPAPDEYSQGHTFRVIVGSVVYRLESIEGDFSGHFEDFRKPIKVWNPATATQTEYPNIASAKADNPKLRTVPAIWGVTSNGLKCLIKLSAGCIQAVWDMLKSDQLAVNIDPGTKKVPAAKKGYTETWLPSLITDDATPEEEAALDAVTFELVEYFRQDIPGYLPQVTAPDAAPAPPEAPEVETEDLPFE